MRRSILLVTLALSGLTVGDFVRLGRHRAEDRHARDVAPLVAALGHRRPIEGRLTGGFQFGEWRSDVRGAELDLQVLAAGAQVQLHAASPHALAVAALLAGDSDRAISLLEDLITDTDASASVASDLAAARLARWRRSGEAFDAVRALDDAGRAIAAQSTFSEALFNRALALDALGLTELGRDAWRRYLEIDAGTAWATEASERQSRASRDGGDLSSVASLRNQLVRALADHDVSRARAVIDERPQVAREFLENELLARWADAHLAARISDDQQLTTDIRLVARLLTGRTGDELWQLIGDELTVLPRSAQSGVARAIRDLLEARARIEANQFDVSAPTVDRLPERLAAVPSLALCARFWQQYVAWHRQEKSTVIAPLEQLRGAAVAHRFGYLHARVSLLLAASLESLVRYDAASDAFRDAIDAFDAHGEVEFAASGRAMAAHLLALQGDLSEAWRRQQAALAAFPWIDSPRRKVVVLANAVLLATRHSLPYAALDIQAALVAQAHRWGDSGALLRYYIERARLSNDLRLSTEAAAAVEAGRGVLQTMTDASNRSLFELDLEIEAARRAMNTNPGDAATHLSDAIRRLPGNTGEFRLAEVYLDLGRARRRSGEFTDALKAWLAGIDVLERQRGTITSEELRISFYSRAWELYDDAIAETLREGHIEAALSLVERSRARALRDGLLATAQTSVADFVSRLPPRTAVLTFASTRDALLVWCLDHTGFRFVSVPWSSVEVERQVTRVRDQVTTGQSDEAVDRMSDALLAPFREQIAAAAHLVLIPDASIGGLPFAALRLNARGGRLIDAVTLTVAPSLSILDVTSRRLTALTTQPPRSGVFIGDPEIDRTVYPSLPRLPNARAEVEESARLYPLARVLLGADATGSALSDAVGKADVVHFAGHAIANPEFPFRATLSVAPEPGHPGFLHPIDLARLSAGATRLVVLSACATASARPAFGEGALSLARPFLAAGVPDVLGTLWDLEDAAGAALVPRFHRWLRAGFAPSDALRRAQLELQSSTDARLRHPRAWSGFVIIGGIDRSSHVSGVAKATT